MADDYTVEGLGKRVKAQHPNSGYGNLSDAEIGKRWKAKYPGKYDMFKDVTPQDKLDKTFPDLKGKQMGGSLPDELLSTLPYIGAGAATLATGGGALPFIAAATLGAGAGSLAERGLREVTGQRPQPFSGVGELAGQTLSDAFTKGTLPEMGGQVINKAVINPLMHYFNPERLYASHLQPSGVTQKEMMKSVRGALREGVPLSKKTPEQAQKLEEGLRHDVENMINSLPKNADHVRMQADLKARLDKLRDKWSKISEFGPEFVKQIDAFEQDFANRFITPGTPGTPATPGSPAIPAGTATPAVPAVPASPGTPGTPPQPRIMQSPELQDIKQGTAEFIRTKGEGNFGANVHPGLNIRLQREVMNVAKTELERLYGPGIKDLNLREGDMIALNKAAEKWATNYMRAGVSPGVPMGMGDLAAHLAKKFLGSPEFNTALAIDLARLRQHAPVRLGIQMLPKAAPNLLRTGEYLARPKTQDQ